MTAGFILLLNLLLLPRLLWLFFKAPGLREAVIIAGAQALLLVLAFNFNPAIATALGLIVIEVMCRYLLPNTMNSEGGYQVLALLLLILLPGFVSGWFPLAFSPLALATANTVMDGQPFVTATDGSQLRTPGVYLAGFLLLANECNIIIRMTFLHLGLVPREKADKSKVDTVEYNAGRVIGILERWLMFLIVMFTSDLTAIAFVFAAKSLVRMEDVRQKDQFAEYLLVGTLLSVLSSLLVGFWLKSQV